MNFRIFFMKISISLNFRCPWIFWSPLVVALFSFSSLSPLPYNVPCAQHFLGACHSVGTVALLDKNCYYFCFTVRELSIGIEAQMGPQIPVTQEFGNLFGEISVWAHVPPTLWSGTLLCYSLPSTVCLFHHWSLAVTSISCAAAKEDVLGCWILGVYFSVGGAHGFVTVQGVSHHKVGLWISKLSKACTSGFLIIWPNILELWNYKRNSLLRNSPEKQEVTHDVTCVILGSNILSFCLFVEKFQRPALLITACSKRATEL